MSNISKTSETLYDETWTIWTAQPTQLVYEIREKSVRARFQVNHDSIFTGWFGHFCNFLQYSKKDKT